jgi:hypothetical protein
MLSLKETLSERHFLALKEATKRVGGMHNLAEIMGITANQIPWWWRRREIPMHRLIELTICFPDLFDFFDMFKSPHQRELTNKFEVETMKAVLSGTLNTEHLILGDEYAVSPRSRDKKKVSKAALEAIAVEEKSGNKLPRDRLGRVIAMTDKGGKKQFLQTISEKAKLGKNGVKNKDK